VKRVLLIAYYFPPQPKAGALRAQYLAERLPDNLWEPTVLTAAYPGQEPTDFKLVAARDLGPDAATPPTEHAQAGPQRRRSKTEVALKSLIKSIVYFPDNHVGWLVPAARAARRLMRSEKFDAVLSTAPPFTAHFVARLAIAGTQTPWIADYRDLWSGPAGPDYLHGSGPLRLSIEYAVERRLLRRASQLTAPSEAQAAALARNFDRTDVACIPNAVDVNVWAAIPDGAPKAFTVCYTGKLWPGLRMPDEVFEAVARLRSAGDPAGAEISFDFYGEDAGLVMERATAFGIGDIVRAHGEVERTRALAAQRSAACLLLLLDTAESADAIQIGNPGSKLFEYAGARRPVLAFGRHNQVVGEMLEQSGLGVLVRDESSCCEALRVLYRKFSHGEFEPVVTPGWSPFTPSQLAARFAELLDTAVAGAKAGRT
jgi:Glycosyl transferase 4-like domain